MVTPEEIVKRLDEVRISPEVRDMEWFQRHFFADEWTLIVVDFGFGRYIGLYPKSMFDLQKIYGNL